MDTDTPKGPTHWYRFRYWLHERISALLRLKAYGLKSPLEVNQALRHQLWHGIEIGKGHYLGHCLRHHDEPLHDMGQGLWLCYKCRSDAFIEDGDAPITDAFSVAHRPALFLRALQHPIVGKETEQHRATWPDRRSV